MSTKAHKAKAPEIVKVAIFSISTTRDLAHDKSGQWMKKYVSKKHRVIRHEVVPDEAGTIAERLKAVIEDDAPDVILTTGGTGIGPKDVTIEAIRPLFSKELTAFGSIFAWLSYEEIDAAALLSRATAGLIGQTVVFCMPGSLKACKLACKALIFPELGHLVGHARESDVTPSQSQWKQDTKQGTDMLKLLVVTSKENRLAELISTLSAHEEVNLSVADSGKKALDMVSNTLYDLVTVDEALQDMTGLELVEGIVRINAMINCAAVSTLSPDDFHEASEGLGLVAQLPAEPKQQDAEDLLERLKAIKGLSDPAR